VIFIHIFLWCVCVRVCACVREYNHRQTTAHTNTQINTWSSAKTFFWQHYGFNHQMAPKTGRHYFSDSYVYFFTLFFQPSSPSCFYHYDHTASIQLHYNLWTVITNFSSTSTNQQKSIFLLKGLFTFHFVFMCVRACVRACVRVFV